MIRPTLGGGAFAVILFLLALAGGDLARDRAIAMNRPTSPEVMSSATDGRAESHDGLVHGRVTTTDGTVYEGRLRWGGDEEAVWGNYFNGYKAENPWVEYVPSGRLPRKGFAFDVFGIEVKLFEKQVDLGRPFMARLGDIARIDGSRRDLRVTLKSGSVFHLDRYAADDLADGLRVWDPRHGVVDIGEWKIRSIELLPGPAPGVGPNPLYGTVRTRHGEFTGFIQWDREACLDTDQLSGRSSDGERGVPFGTIGSIVKSSNNSSRVTLLDGSEVVLSDARAVGEGNRGIYVDDDRYGRVLVSWDAFERVDFSAGGTGPAYGAFPVGRTLMGAVTTRSGRRVAGRLVFDLDESETTETLDAPVHGVDYTIPFSRIANVLLPGLAEGSSGQARVTLQSGEELRLDLLGDLGGTNAGMLIFSEGIERPEYVLWKDVQRVDFD